MFNVGVGFMLFGLGLWIYSKISSMGDQGRQKTTATIVGYKQFPTDATITDDTISRGPYFQWLRVVEFTHPTTNQTLQMYSNPGVTNPEPIGTRLEISFNPDKTDPITDFVWIEGSMRVSRDIGLVSFATGLVLFFILLFVPESSPLHFVLILPAFLVVLIYTYTRVWKQPNQ